MKSLSEIIEELELITLMAAAEGSSFKDRLEVVVVQLKELDKQPGPLGAGPASV